MIDLSQPESQILVIIGLAALIVGIGLGVLVSFSRGRGRTRQARAELGQVEREYKELRRNEQWGRAKYQLGKMKESYNGIPELSRRVRALE